MLCVLGAAGSAAAGRSLVGQPQQDSEAGQGGGELAGELADRGLSPGPSRPFYCLAPAVQSLATTPPLWARSGICETALAGCEGDSGREQAP